MQLQTLEYATMNGIIKELGLEKYRLVLSEKNTQRNL